MTRSQKRPLSEASNPHAKQIPVDAKRVKLTPTRSASKAVATTVPKAASKTNTKAPSKSKATPKSRAAPQSKAAPKSKAVPKTKANSSPKVKASTSPPQSPPPFSPSANPRATLTGLPAELRLHIYSYLRETDLIHVHWHPATETTDERFTWTPCRGTDASNRLLCANPKWSGTCTEEERCTYNTVTPSEPRGFHALAASSKALRDEAMGLLSRCEGVSIPTIALRPWLSYMEQRAPKHLEQLRRVTLEARWGRREYGFFGITDSDGLECRLPRLKAVGVQSQGWLPDWVTTSRGPDVTMRTDAMSKRWQHTKRLMISRADIKTTIEIMVHWNPRRIPNYMCNPDVVEQMISVRFTGSVLKDGGEVDNRGTVIWKEEDVEVIQPKHLLGEPKQNAKWREWWKTDELRY
jgi:hypothetical protein